MYSVVLEINTKHKTTCLNLNWYLTECLRRLGCRDAFSKASAETAATLAGSDVSGSIPTSSPPVHRLLWMRTSASQQPGIPISLRKTFYHPYLWSMGERTMCRMVFPAQKSFSCSGGQFTVIFWPYSCSPDPIHALLTTSVLPQNRTYRHALILPVPSHRIAEMHLFSCLKTTLTVKWASRFITFPFKHSLEESTKGWSSAKADQE